MRNERILSVIVAATLSVAAQAGASTYSETVKHYGPKAYWGFEDASSANGATAASQVNPATYNGHYQSGSGTGGVTFGTSAFGTLGQSAVFHNTSLQTTLATSDAVLASAAGLPSGNSDRTLLFWERDAVPAGAQYQGQIEYGTPGNFNGAYGTSIFALADSNSPNHGQAVSQWGDGTGTTVAADDGAWHFVAVVTEGSKYSIYLDGVLANSPKTMTTSTVISQMMIGSSTALTAAPGSIVGWNGGLDEVAVFDRALSGGLISDFYATAVPEPTTLSLLGVGAVGLLARRRGGARRPA